MKIHKNEYKDVLEYMEKQYNHGNTYVAFLMDFTAVQKEDMECFKTFWDAQEYCYEMSTDLDYYGQLPIQNIIYAMKAEEDGVGLHVEDN